MCLKARSDAGSGCRGFNQYTICFDGRCLQRRHGDYVTLFEPVASTLEDEGVGHVLASVGVAAGNIPFTAYCAKKSFIEENKDLIQRFTNAIYKGQQFVKEHSRRRLPGIKPAFPDSDLELLTKVARRYKEQDSWPAAPALKEDDFNHLQDIMEMAGELDERLMIS